MPSARPHVFVRSMLLLAISGTVAFAAGCGGSDESGSSDSGADTPTIQASTGKEIFQKSGCISCHVLADAGGAGRIGPNLDEDRPSRETVIRVVTDGDGRMPSFKDRLTTEQIEELGTYIAQVTGQ